MLFDWLTSSVDDVREDVSSLRETMEHAFHNIKREFDDHLSAINQNTSEIQSVYDYMAEIDKRVGKLEERVDELQMYVNPEMEEVPEIDLTLREQEVFFLLYTQGEAVSAAEIGRRLGFTREMVNKYVYNMVSKGVPVIKDDRDDETMVRIDASFRTLQAKQEIVDVDRGIRQQFNERGEHLVRE